VRVVEAVAGLGGGSPNQTQGNGVKSIFVGNLDVKTTEEELGNLFEGYGKVEHVNIIGDRESGLPRGFAFVEMTNEDEAAKAIEALNGSILRDHTLRVDYARPKLERRAG
jgi:RNA recognition motif-containing protein